VKSGNQRRNINVISVKINTEPLITHICVISILYLHAEIITLVTTYFIVSLIICFFIGRLHIRST
jgi:hypothetical protein